MATAAGVVGIDCCRQARLKADALCVLVSGGVGAWGSSAKPARDPSPAGPGARYTGVATGPTILPLTSVSGGN